MGNETFGVHEGALEASLRFRQVVAHHTAGRPLKQTKTKDSAAGTFFAHFVFTPSVVCENEGR